MDRYTKFILTVIALGLWALVVALFWQPRLVQAQYGTQKVKVVGWEVYTPIDVEVSRISTSATPIPVDLKQINGRGATSLGWSYLTPPVPVEIRK